MNMKKTVKQQILFLLCLSLVACSSEEDSTPTPSMPEVDTSSQEETGTEENSETEETSEAEDSTEEEEEEEEPVVEVVSPPLPNALLETAIGDISALTQDQAAAYEEIIYSQNQEFLIRQNAYNAAAFYKFAYDGPMYVELVGNNQGEAGLLVKHWDFDSKGLDVIHILYYLWDGANIYEVDDLGEFAELEPTQSAVPVATLLNEYANLVVE